MGDVTSLVAVDFVVDGTSLPVEGETIVTVAVGFARARASSARIRK